MNRMDDIIERVEYYRSNGLPGGDIESPSKTSGSTGSQTRSAIEAPSGEEEAMSREREEQLELWRRCCRA